MSEDLIGLGMPAELAVAVAAAIASAPALPDLRDFAALGLSHEQAALVSNGIESQSLPAPDLMALGMTSALANYMSEAVKP